MIYLLFSFDALQIFKNILHPADSYTYHCLMKIVSSFFIIAIVHNYKNLERKGYDSSFRLDFLAHLRRY